jgi:hypothetical protein
VAIIGRILLLPLPLPYILPHGSIVFPDGLYAKLKMFISELILDKYECIPVAYITMHCMIRP